MTPYDILRKISIYLFQATRSTDIVTNEFIEKPEVFKAPHVAMMKVRSPQCFDHGFYRDANWDFQGWTDEQLWHNFVHSGQFEARPHRSVALYLPPSLHCDSKGLIAMDLVCPLPSLNADDWMYLGLPQVIHTKPHAPRSLP